MRDIDSKYERVELAQVQLEERNDKAAVHRLGCLAGAGVVVLELLQLVLATEAA